MIVRYSADMRVLADERRARILDRLERDGRVVAADLVDELGVSHDTVRRDLDELEAAGRLRRVHGGALPPAVGAAPYEVRREQEPAAKEAIGRAAAGLMRDGQVVFLDAGTTALAVADAVPAGLSLTVVTNSPEAGLALARRPRVEVILLGGILSPGPRATVGGAVVEALARIRADLCILGVCALHPEIGLTVTDLEESHVKRAMIAGATDVVAVTTAAKLGSTGHYVVAPVGELTHLVTDADPGAPELAALRDRGITVVHADA